jgi:hypothetical protein
MALIVLASRCYLYVSGTSLLTQRRLVYTALILSSIDTVISCVEKHNQVRKHACRVQLDRPRGFDQSVQGNIACQLGYRKPHDTCLSLRYQSQCVGDTNNLARTFVCGRCCVWKDCWIMSLHYLASFVVQDTNREKFVNALHLINLGELLKFVSGH